MLVRLLTLAATAAIAKKGWDTLRERQAPMSQGEREALEQMARDIQPQASEKKPARKTGAKRARRSDGPSAE